MVSRITIRDLSQLSSIGVSQRGTQNFLAKDFQQLSLRPTILSNET